jgi:hypothetical protein
MAKQLPQLSSEAAALRSTRRKRAASCTGHPDLVGAALICMAAGLWELKLGHDVLGPATMGCAMAYLGVGANLIGLHLVDSHARRAKLVPHG